MASKDLAEVGVMNAEIVELEEIELAYGFVGTSAIVDHPALGRLWLLEGFGGINTAEGGRAGWRYGIAVQLQPTDTLKTLESEPLNDYTTLKSAVKAGHDPTRPMLQLDVAELAQACGVAS